MSMSTSIRDTLESTLRRRFFYTPSFEIYGGVSGLFDLGPPGCQLQNNLIQLWREHFVMEEDMLEIDGPMLTPYDVLKTSGHVDKFTDWMCQNPKTGEYYRADHLIEQTLKKRLLDRDVSAKDFKKMQKILDTIDGFRGSDLNHIMQEYKINDPVTNDVLDPLTSFNLMFRTKVGASGQLKAFLRPETAQGQFLNFNKLLDINQGKIPFASASIGKSFRNEISPRSGLLRVREFLMAEIEYFVDPLDKSHPKFDEVSAEELTLLSRQLQESGNPQLPVKLTIGEAVKSGMVENETLGYFMARVHQFLLKLGIDNNKFRFRQHLKNEMAHYATDCWDGELLTSYGWIECIGCADRAAFDLTVHSKKTGKSLMVKQRLNSPKEKIEWVLDVNKKLFGPQFKYRAKKIESVLLRFSQEELRSRHKELKEGGKFTCQIDGDIVELDDGLVSIEMRTTLQHTREYIPNVIEPSFGLGRIIYCIFDHCFRLRADNNARAFFSFPLQVAPIKVLITTISNNENFPSIVKEISQILRKREIYFKVDDSNTSIGKKYARNDELGIPFGITIDFETLNDKTVTLRERDSTKQVRGSVDDVISVIDKMIRNPTESTWDNSTVGCV
ncbi:GRS2-like protein [Saccharomyces kudriavzevii IFO 1802]|uniref:glycine--tRNA ligase n=2 Tax=Saccharomyces kudriavzevii (strain ATCC MYA-4449 / AS 2.2408 / CBS 8840 / NBRC 1802 / NCYC 2889) TaxID=226230 RepID=J8TH64_SACK1|nr:GRS2-like protein [Saccharomyces kudriavzevii IFO 1802]